MPNRPDPLYPTYSAYPYIDANGNGTNDPGTDAPAPTAVPTSPNIDPNAGQPAGPPTPTPTERAQQGATVAGQTTPTVGTAQGPGGMFTPDQMTAQTASEVQQANLNVAATWEQIRQQQDLVTRYQSGDLQSQAVANPNLITAASSTLNSLYSQLSAAEQRVETANAAYSTALGKAVVDPSQVQLQNANAAKADADAAQAKAQAKVLLDGADTQRAYVAAQAGQAAAAAAASQAQADATRAKTPAEAAALNAQAAASQAQANQANALLPGLLQKQQADITQTEAQTGLTDANSDYVRAQTAAEGARGRLADAQAVLAGAQGTQLVPAQATYAQAQTGTELAKQKQALLGPMYGLQDQLNAIRSIQQQVFGPGGSGNADDANKLLQDYVTATVSGTTPYAASVAAANYGQNIFGTQAAMANAAQSAAASRANAFLGTGANVLGTLASLNANAPAGSTAGADAFNEVMRNMMGQVGGQQAFAPPTLPTAPALPGVLARMAGTAGTAGTPVTQAAQPAATPAAAAAPNAGAGAVNINIGTSGQTTTATPTPPGGYAANQPGTYGALSGAMPSMLQNYAPITDVGQLGAAMSKIWGYS